MIEIRSLTKADNVDDLIFLSREFFEEYEVYHKDFFKIDNLTEEQIVDYFTSFRDSEFREVFIALDNEHIVAYMTVYVKHQADYWQIKRIGDISGLMVQKEYRHRGIAKKLLGKAKDFFARQEVKYFTVFTAIENQGAINFYRDNCLIPLSTTLLGEIRDSSV